jgi:hypothetical protein
MTPLIFRSRPAESVTAHLSTGCAVTPESLDTTGVVTVVLINRFTVTTRKP